jgi:plasmid stabilization system protein ParE
VVPRAAQDLEDACDFIAHDSESAAERLAKRVIEATRQLASFPRSGRIAPEFGRGDIREVIIQSHRVVYRLVGDDVQIATIRHAARLLDRSAFDGAERGSDHKSDGRRRPR